MKDPVPLESISSSAASSRSEPAPTAPRSQTLLVAALGLALGAGLVFVLPSGWILRSAPVINHADHSGEPAVQYACPMFCVIMDRVPLDGKCPVCGMSMTVVSADTTLNPEERRMIGLRADVARRIPLARTIRAVAEVDYDETKLARITTRVGGWLETVWIDSTWTEVEVGEPLAAIYSPELYSAEQEYLVAWRSVQGDGSGSSTIGTLRTSDLLHASRRRLELLGVDKREITDLEQTGFPRDSVVMRAPMSGAVVERRAVEGASVAKGAILYTVADLSEVWVQALIFEADLPWVRVGQAVRLQTDGGSAPLLGEVAFVDPAIDRNSRTARVRVVVQNPLQDDGSRLLRIGQRVDAWLEATLNERGQLLPPGADESLLPLAVPRSAVLSTGERQLIYVLFTEVETDTGRERDYSLDPNALPRDLWYEAVQVRVGPIARAAGAGGFTEYYPVLDVVAPRAEVDPKTGDEIEVLSLRRFREGVTVVVDGNLLLDSQAQLAGKPSLLFPDGNRGSSSDPHAGH